MIENSLEELSVMAFQSLCSARVWAADLCGRTLASSVRRAKPSGVLYSRVVVHIVLP